MANDHRVKELVVDAYGYARQMGIGRLGVFPTFGEATEGCTVADMVALAVTLTDAGLGDYWDDVEKYARNGLLCVQATDLDELRRVSEEGKERPPYAPWGGTKDGRFAGNHKGILPSQEIHDRVLERSVGAFGFTVGARYLNPRLMHCCTANGSQGLFFAWEGILRRNGASVDVNMWLNRRSPWADVWSWLPHEGRLLVQNEGMGQLAVRKPGWANRSQIRCQIDGRDVQPRWIGGRMLFDGLRGTETVLITTPVNIGSATYTVVNLADPQNSQEQYACEFRGHTAVDVRRVVAGSDPEDHNWYRLFRREAMKSDVAPLKTPPPYVHPEKLLDWLMLV